MNVIKYSTAFRNLIAGAETKVPLKNGQFVTAVNFDNAATTPPLIPVLQDLNNFAPWYSSIHRGSGYKSQVSSQFFDDSRVQILNFVKADLNKYMVIYVKNTTEAINKLSFRLCEHEKSCVILSTCMEHHSNDLPWRNKYTVDYIEIDKSGRLSLPDLQAKLTKYKGRVKLVTVTGASNVTGYKNPIYTIARMVHDSNAKLLVDGAQLIPHAPFDMKSADTKEHIDYLAFSAHKMYAPFGIGVLIGPQETFEKGDPEYRGGGTVRIVTHDLVEWDQAPNKDEAGSPNLMGVVALISAVNTLDRIGMRNIESYEKKLTDYALLRLCRIPGIHIYGDPAVSDDRISIISFNIDGLLHEQVASILAEEAGISVRSGCFCAHPYVARLLEITPEEVIKRIHHDETSKPGMVRISFGLYNTYDEIDRLVWILHRITSNKVNFIKTYQRIAP